MSVTFEESTRQARSTEIIVVKFSILDARVLDMSLAGATNCWGRSLMKKVA